MTEFNETEIDFDNETIEIIDNNKYVTFYRKDEKGVIYKHTKIYRIEKNEIKITKSVAKRRKWTKFGVSAGLPSGPDTASTNRVFDEVFFEFTNNSKVIDDKLEESGMFGSANKNLVTCKHCGGNHWSMKCNNKPDNSDKKEVHNNGKYIPKFKRDGTKPVSKNRNTLRISNISTNATDEDIRELFYNYGRITKLYYNQKGFAYITYSELSSCERAINNVNGHPYDHLILSVEMAEEK